LARLPVVQLVKSLCLLLFATAALAFLRRDLSSICGQAIVGNQAIKAVLPSHHAGDVRILGMSSIVIQTHFVFTACFLQFKRFMHIERVRLERQSGRALHSELPNLVLQNKIQFLDNVPSVYSAIGLFMMLIWCPAMGFVFWADNYYRSSSYPFNNGTGYSMIDSVFMTTSAFSNSGLKSAPLFHSTLGGKILILFAMVSYAPHVYDVVGLYLYRRRIAQFIRQVPFFTAALKLRAASPIIPTLTLFPQHVDSYEWADCAEDLCVT
jgi:hypothetical protein